MATPTKARGTPNMARTPTASNDKPKVKRTAPLEHFIYLVGTAEQLNGIVVEKDKGKVLEALNAAAESGKPLISRKVLIPRQRKTGADAGADAAESASE